MNREIKFRGQDLSTKEWIVSNGFLSHLDKTVVMVLHEHKEGWTTGPVIKDTVGQFTGLKDKNGVDIYEGDIVTWDKYILVVIYEDNGFWLYSQKYKFHSLEFKDCKVIGNIYENPELLK